MSNPELDKAKARLARVIAKAKSYLGLRKRAYQLVFEPEISKVVLEDLTKFCRGTESTFHQDPRMHALMEGRREVLLRITQHLNLSFNDLWELYDGRKLHDD